MRLGVMGGTFDPIHLGHLRAAESARESVPLDLVLFVPSSVPPHRDPPATSGRDRLEMVRLATASHPGFDASDVELRREGHSFTVDTLRDLSRMRPDDELFLVVGSDTYAELDGWREPEVLRALCRVVVVARPDADAPANTQALCVDGPTLPVSATQIRERVRAGRSVRFLVPDDVAAYIEARGLYR